MRNLYYAFIQAFKSLLFHIKYTCIYLKDLFHFIDIWLISIDRPIFFLMNYSAPPISCNQANSHKRLAFSVLYLILRAVYLTPEIRYSAQ